MKIFFKTLCTIILVAITILIASQSITKIYRTPSSSSFAGDKFYNPYALIDSMTWSSGFKKANFHAHTRWDVNGSYTVPEFSDAYKYSNYDIITIADHNHITLSGSANAFAPTYEHGTNLNNFHKLMLDAETVDYVDIPLMLLARHQMQYAIERLGAKTGVISINHPERVRMVPDNVFGELRGFSLMEINPDADTRFWDQILSAGNFTALIASDDAHSITNRNSWFQRAFTMVATSAGADKKPTDAQILDALKLGQAYAVVVSNERNAQGAHSNIPTISNISMVGDAMSIKVSDKAEKIVFRGVGGREIASFANVDSASQSFSDGDAYMRVEVQMSDGIRFFTNPIVRSVDGAVPAQLPLPESVLWLTILNIVCWNVLAVLFLIVMLVVVWRKRRKRANFENFMWGAGLKVYDPN